VTWGGDAVGATRFDGWVDEVSVHTAPGNGVVAGPLGRASYALDEALSATAEDQLILNPNLAFVDGYPTYAPTAGAFLVQFPSSGILDLDGERIAYVEFSSSDGRFTLAPNGRGLHGTERRAHAVGARAFACDGRFATALNADLPAGGEILLVDDAGPFPRGGLLLVDQELMHAPHRTPNGGLLAMPRLPEREDARDPGGGALRGRFGTLLQDHTAGSPVYSFPTRWMDGYEPRCDDPALSWCEFGFEAPNAYWRGLAWEEESPDGTQRVRALARAGTAAWTDDPETTPGLVAFDRGRSEQGGFVPLRLRADRLELRLFFDWEAGSFDAQTFLATGWTRAPRVRSFLLDYLAETRVEKRVELRE
jgi:hypothetical protein